MIYIFLYVDDILIASNDMVDVKKFKDLLKLAFEMKDWGNAKKILGIELRRDRGNDKIFISYS